MVAIFCTNRGVAQSVERLTVPTVVGSILGARSILRVLNGNCEMEELSLPCMPRLSFGLPPKMAVSSAEGDVTKWCPQFSCSIQLHSNNKQLLDEV